MHMGPNVTRHWFGTLATRFEPMLHVAKTDVSQDPRTTTHCPGSRIMAVGSCDWPGEKGDEDDLPAAVHKNACLEKAEGI